MNRCITLALMIGLLAGCASLPDPEKSGRPAINFMTTAGEEVYATGWFTDFNLPEVGQQYTMECIRRVTRMSDEKPEGEQVLSWKMAPMKIPVAPMSSIQAWMPMGKVQMANGDIRVIDVGVGPQGSLRWRVSPIHRQARSPKPAVKPEAKPAPAPAPEEPAPKE